MAKPIPTLVCVGMGVLVYVRVHVEYACGVSEG
jgi:hypothetical protein